MKIIRLTNEEIEMIKVWLNTYEPFPEDSKKQIEREKYVIQNIMEKLQ